MNRLSSRNRFFAASGALLALVAGSGCSNVMRAGVNMAPGSDQNPNVNYTNVTSNGGYPNDTDYNCPSSPGVQTYSGADPYTICVGTESPFDLSLHGSPTAGKSAVCVFPVDVISSTQAYAVSNSSSEVVDQCVDMSSGYNTVEFTGGRFNGAFVVAAADESSMSTCLLNGNYDICPAYSYERWAAYDTGTPLSQ